MLLLHRIATQWPLRVKVTLIEQGSVHNGFIIRRVYLILRVSNAQRRAVSSQCRGRL